MSKIGAQKLSNANLSQLGHWQKIKKEERATQSLQVNNLCKFSKTLAYIRFLDTSDQTNPKLFFEEKIYDKHLKGKTLGF